MVQWTVLLTTHGLTPDALAALADLEARTVAADGGRLKLEWGVLRERAAHAGEGTADAGGEVLWWEGDRLLGFAGVYAFGASGAEIAGMVDPAARRRGIGTALLDAALEVCRDRDDGRVLLVTPRASTAGAAFALGRGAVLEHSEHALVLTGEPADGPTDPRVGVRTATPADVPAVTRMLEAAFGWRPGDVLDRLVTDSERTLLVEFTGAPDRPVAGPPRPAGPWPVGTVRVTRDGSTGGVYGFAVDPAWQGRGIGRDVLRRVCRDLRAAGAHRVGLEVAVENEHALGLYTSVGFTRVTTEDYHALLAA